MSDSDVAPIDRVSRRARRATTPPVASERSSRKRRGRSPPRKPHGGSDHSDSDDADDHNMCYLCELPAEGKMAQWRGQNFHKKCQLAIQCHLRLCSKTPKGTDAAVHSFEPQPAKWRKTVMPLVIHDSRATRSSAARTAAKMQMTLEDNFQETAVVEQKFLFNKRRYKTWR